MGLPRKESIYERDKLFLQPTQHENKFKKLIINKFNKIAIIP